MATDGWADSNEATNRPLPLYDALAVVQHDQRCGLPQLAGQLQSRRKPEGFRAAQGGESRSTDALMLGYRSEVHPPHAAGPVIDHLPTNG
jgi:hypothetical protein